MLISLLSLAIAATPDQMTAFQKNYACKPGWGYTKDGMSYSPFILTDRRGRQYLTVGVFGRKPDGTLRDGHVDDADLDSTPQNGRISDADLDGVIDYAYSDHVGLEVPQEKAYWQGVFDAFIVEYNARTTCPQ